MQEQPLIAIIDDDASVRTALSGLVRSLGRRARAFESAEAFLAESVSPDCIVSDVHMPGLSGLQLLSRLGSGAAPVILITARAETGLQEMAQAGGAFCVLKKPFAAEALLDCIERALASRAPAG